MEGKIPDDVYVFLLMKEHEELQKKHNETLEKVKLRKLRAKESCRKYYAKNKERWNIKGKITCTVCQLEMRVQSYATHLQTKRHEKNLGKGVVVEQVNFMKMIAEAMDKEDNGFAEENMFGDIEPLDDATDDYQERKVVYDDETDDSYERYLNG